MERPRTARILVVDDDPVILTTYRLSLEEEYELTHKNGTALNAIENCLFDDHGAEAPITENWRIDYCDQGLDAVAAVKDAVDKRDPYSLVFLDVRMPPGIDGYETAIAIRQMDSDVRAGLSEWATGTLHNVRNGLAPLTAFTWQIRQLYGQNWMANVESAVKQYEEPTLPDDRREKLHAYIRDSVPRLLECGRKASEMAINMDAATKSVLDIVSEFDRYANRNTELSRVDALPVITSAVASCSKTNEDVEFVVPSHSAELWTNSVILSQVLVNAILNSIEALEGVTHPKRIEVAIALSSETCIFVVNDNGRGMSAKAIAKAFQMGQSARQGRARGLGLHWCANAVKLLSGDIRISSEGPGQGAELRIELPKFNSEVREAA